MLLAEETHRLLLWIALGAAGVGLIGFFVAPRFTDRGLVRLALAGLFVLGLGAVIGGTTQSAQVVIVRGTPPQLHASRYIQVLTATVSTPSGDVRLPMDHEKSWIVNASTGDITLLRHVYAMVGVPQPAPEPIAPGKAVQVPTRKIDYLGPHHQPPGAMKSVGGQEILYQIAW